MLVSHQVSSFSSDLIREMYPKKEKGVLFEQEKMTGNK